MNTLGQRLKRLRLERELTQEDIGKKLNVVKQAVSNWENDITTPDINTIIILADFYRLPICYLLGRLNDRHNPGVCQSLAIMEEESSYTVYSERDRLLLEKFHLLSPDKQRAIETLIGIRHNSDRK